jgi:hypothetical protein
MRCAFALALCCLALVSSWARPESIPSTASPPAVSAPSSPTLSDIAARLSALSTALSSEASAQSTELQESKSLLEESRNALLSSQASLDKAARETRLRSLDAALWRFGALSGVLGAGGSLLEPAKAQGAAIGAGIGAAIALAWTIFDYWPPWK